MTKITRRAAETLKAIQIVNAMDEEHVLRIDIEGDGYSLWLGPQQKGDTWLGSKDTVLLRATPDVVRLFRKSRMVIDCLDHQDGTRLVVYPEDDPPPELHRKTRRIAEKSSKNKR